MFYGINNTLEDWKKYSQGKEVRTLRLYDHEIFDFVKDFKTHREYIKAAFHKMGYEVTKYNHTYKSFGYGVEAWGLVYARGDSDVLPCMEVHGIIGENLQRLNEGIV